MTSAHKKILFNSWLVVSALTAFSLTCQKLAEESGQAYFPIILSVAVGIGLAAVLRDTLDLAASVWICISIHLMAFLPATIIVPFVLASIHPTGGAFSSAARDDSVVWSVAMGSPVTFPLLIAGLIILSFANRMQKLSESKRLAPPYSSDDEPQ